jgi:hypothetical protein
VTPSDFVVNLMSRFFELCKSRGRCNLLKEDLRFGRCPNGRSAYISGLVFCFAGGWLKEKTAASKRGPAYYSVNYETYICDGVEYPQIWANEVIIGPHIQPAGYFSNPTKLKNQP